MKRVVLAEGAGVVRLYKSRKKMQKKERGGLNPPLQQTRTLALCLTRTRP